MNPAAYDEISAHIATHIGKPLDTCLTELVGALRIQVVPPTEQRPVHTLITTGMSDFPMAAPAGREDYRHVELFMLLPAKWPMTKEAWEKPEHYWPIEWMRMIAHSPEEGPIYLESQQTLGSPDAEPFAPNTKLSSMMLLEDLGKFGVLKLKDGRTIRFYQLIPLYEEERALKAAKGTRALFERFARHNLGPVINPFRVNVAG